MEKRLTSSNKRIVEFCGLMESEDLLKFIGRNQSVLETSSWGGKGIDQEKTRQLLNEYLEPYQFEITKDYTTPNNIGNNHLYYIQDKDVLDDIETLIGRIAINNLMGYAVAIYQEDMDGKRIGKSYLEITARGVKEAPNEKWIGWNQYIQDNHLNWNLNDLEKEREIRFIIRQCIEEEILQVENGYIMVIRESADGSTVWYPTTYEQVIEDLKNERQFQVFRDALYRRQVLSHQIDKQMEASKDTLQQVDKSKEKQESENRKQVFQQSLKDMQEVYDKIVKFNKEHKAPLGTEKYEYELYVYMKQNGLNVHLAEEYENGEFLKDFDYGLVTGTIYGYPDKELRLSEDFEIWSKDGEYFGAYSKKDIMDKLDGLNAEKQKTLLINPNDYGKIIQDMVKVAKASDNHTWFLEPEEFLDKTYAQEDLDELSRDLQSIKEAGVHDMYSIVEMWDDWKEADEHGEPVATFHGAFLDLFAKEKSQSIDKNLISFNSCIFEINLDSKDNGEGCLKWHNYFLTDIHNKDHFYIIQIVQETGKEEPRFSLEKFEKEEGSKLYLGEWVELEDVIKNSSEIEMVQNKLIELSDKEIGIQNEEIKNIEDDFEELDEVEK